MVFVTLLQKRISLYLGGSKMKKGAFLLAIVLLGLVRVAWGAANPKYAGTPYENIAAQIPNVLEENTNSSDQVSDFNEVDFFVVENNAPESKVPFPIADVELVFSCPQSKAASGWFISLWKHYADNSEINESGRKPLKSYDVSPEQCKDQTFTLTIPKNKPKTKTTDVSSYYIGVQGGCSRFPDLARYYDTNTISAPIPCDRSDYKLKLGLLPKEIVADTNTLIENELKSSIPLGTIKTGQIKSITDKNIYSVETYSTTDTAGTNEVPLLFSCTAAAARQTNDWKLTVYDDDNTVIAGYPRFINGSDCGSTLVDDKGGFKFTLPKDSTNKSPRYFISVQSACESQSKCTVETSQYNITRDVTKIYTGSLMAGFKPDNFKLNRCGLNANSRIEVKIENIKTWDEKNKNGLKLEKNKTPIKIQIGTMACQILTPDSFSPAELMLGSITGNAEIIDTSLIAKDSATVTLGECLSSNAPNAPSKITLTGTKLDLENLNPSPTLTTATTAATSSSNSVVIPVKVDIGDFHCEGRDAFYINADKPKVGDTTYSNNLPTDIEDLTPAINLEASKTGKIETATDMQLYYVDSSINGDTVVNFSCDDSKRFNNDWKVLVYNSNKTLNGTPHVINGSDCGLGEDSDNGAYKITIPKESSSVRYYVAVKSACEADDSSCVVDKSTYTLSREMESILPPPVIIDTPVVVADPNAFNTSWMTTKKNLGASQTGQITSLTDTQIYQVDTGTTDANLTFGCLNSVRYQNDWKMLIYDNTKTLKSTTVINGSACGIGRVGDTGTYPILLTKDSPTYYVVVKSACESDDKTCVIDKSQYEIKRITPVQAVANAAAKPCFGAGCATTTPAVKPFFK